MNKTRKTRMIEYLIYDYLFLTKQMDIGLEVSLGTSGRADIVAFNQNNSMYVIEIKTSVSDFRSKNGHNFVGNINYYALTPEVYEKVKDEIPEHIGVFIGQEFKSEEKTYPGLTTVKYAKKIKSEYDKNNYKNYIKENIKTSKQNTIRKMLRHSYERSKK